VLALTSGPTRQSALAAAGPDWRVAELDFDLLGAVCR
jgi:hypothetical protein